MSDLSALLHEETTENIGAPKPAQRAIERASEMAAFKSGKSGRGRGQAKSKPKKKDRSPSPERSPSPDPEGGDEGSDVVTSAKKTIEKHLDNVPVSKDTLKKARETLREMKVFPIGAPKRRRMEAFSSTQTMVEEPEESKEFVLRLWGSGPADPTPLPEPNAQKSAPRNIRALGRMPQHELARQQRLAASMLTKRAENYGRMAQVATHEYNTTVFGKEGADVVRDRTQYLAEVIAVAAFDRSISGEERTKMITNALAEHEAMKREAIFSLGGEAAVAEYDRREYDEAVRFVANSVVEQFLSGEVRKGTFEMAYGQYAHAAAMNIGESIAHRTGVYSIPEQEFESEAKEKEFVADLSDSITRAVESDPENQIGRDVWKYVQMALTDKNRFFHKRVVPLLKFLLGSFLIASSYYAGYTWIRSFVDPTKDLADAKELQEQVREGVEGQAKALERTRDRIQTALDNSEQNISSEELAARTADFRGKSEEQIKNTIGAMSSDMGEQTQNYIKFQRERIAEIRAQSGGSEEVKQRTIARREADIREIETRFSEFSEAAKTGDSVDVLVTYTLLADSFIGPTGSGMLKKSQALFGELVTAMRQTLVDTNESIATANSIMANVDAVLGKIRSAESKLKMSMNESPVYTSVYNFLADIKIDKDGKLIDGDKVKDGWRLGKGLLTIPEQLGFDAFRSIEVLFNRTADDLAKAWGGNESYFAMTGNAIQALLTNGLGGLLMVMNNSWVASVMNFFNYGGVRVLKLITECTRKFTIEVAMAAFGEKTMDPGDWISPYEFNFGYSDEDYAYYEEKLSPFFNFVTNSLDTAQNVMFRVTTVYSKLSMVIQIGGLITQLFVSTFAAVMVAGTAATFGSILLIGGVFAALAYLLHRYKGISLVSWVANAWLKHPYWTQFGIFVVQAISVAFMYKFGVKKFDTASALLGEEAAAKVSGTTFTGIFSGFQK